MALAAVRPAVVADLDAIVASQTAAWREAYRGLVPDSYLDDPAVLTRRGERWAARLAGERDVLVAVTADNEIVGVASFGPSRDRPPVTELELMSLYVRAGFHGTGIADDLLRAALGTRPASLWVFEQNPRARGFYARHGFRPDGHRALDEGTGVIEIRMVRGMGPGSTGLHQHAS